jgi:hypothetical protein
VLSEYYKGNDAAAEAFDDPDLRFVDLEEDDDLLYPSIAVVGVDNENGSWQFSTDSAKTWRTFENVSESNAILLSSAISNRIRFVPNPDYHGTVTNGLSFRAWDQTTANPNILEELKRSGRRADTTNNGGSTAFSTAVGQLSITVFSVNDAPSFSAGPDQTVSRDSGLTTVIGWASDISPGATNELEQSLSFLLNNDSPSLFATRPSISSDGTLHYMPAENAVGTAEITVQLRDDGGTERGGIDTSSVHTLRITIQDRSQLLGDVDDDGMVGFSDFLIFASNFGRQGQVTFADGDFDGDGRIDFSDFLLLTSNFGTGSM